MHGKVWMFSNLIDDEDIEFMQHEFISYKQAILNHSFQYQKLYPMLRNAFFAMCSLPNRGIPFKTWMILWLFIRNLLRIKL